MMPYFNEEGCPMPTIFTCFPSLVRKATLACGKGKAGFPPVETRAVVSNVAQSGKLDDGLG